MNPELEEFERLVEREAQILAHLPGLEPWPACVARLEEMVREEARRSVRLRRLALPLGAVAATVLLAAFLLPTANNRGTFQAETEDAVGVSLWAEAVDRSSSALASLLEEGWLTDAGGAETDVERDLETLFQSFEQTFTQFQHL